MKNKTLIIPIIILASSICVVTCLSMVCVSTVGLAVFRYQSVDDAGDSDHLFTDWQPIQEGDQAPDFTLDTLTGELVQLAELRGNPVLLSFGASWCPPCRDEVLTLQGLHETFPDLFVLMVDIGEGYWVVQDFAAEYELSFTIALDGDESVAVEYGVFAIPSLFFIDESGIVQAASVGAPSHQELMDFLVKIGIKSGGW